jgi:N-methylhydantoinase B
VNTTQKAGSGFDPMLLSVIANRLDAIGREMTNTLLRSGRSAILNTARDFSCSLVTADNRLLAAAEGLPIHILGSENLTRAMQEFHPNVREGDAFLHNDPYNGNTHPADHTILVPVFHGNKHVFTACAKAHQADCGNSQPTSYMAFARDVYEEGALIFPCVKIQDRYEHVEDIIRMCRARIRVPDQWFGDYLATLGAARIGERRLKGLIEKYGEDVLGRFVEEWFTYSERRMVEALRKLPKGSFEASGRHDPVPAVPDGIPVKVKVEIDPEQGWVDVDLRDNIDCVPAGFNESRTCAIGAATIGVLNALPEEVPHNDGSLRRIRVQLRENCVVGIPREPASCSVATTNVSDRVINTTQRAFAELGDAFGLAEGAVGMGPAFGVISGLDARRDEAAYVNQFYTSSSGGPGAPEEDGWLFYVIPACAGLMYRDSVEVAEHKYPLVVDEIRLMTDSEGAGRFRGAPGSRVIFGPTERAMRVAYLCDGYYNPPQGVRGGLAAQPHDVFKIGVDGTWEDLDKIAILELQPGEKIVDLASGGGGYGPPLERDPARVQRDVAARYVSVERAREVYGVLFREGALPGALEVDDEATAEERSARSSSSSRSSSDSVL